MIPLPVVSVSNNSWLACAAIICASVKSDGDASAANRNARAANGNASTDCNPRAANGDSCAPNPDAHCSADYGRGTRNRDGLSQDAAVAQRGR